MVPSIVYHAGKKGANRVWDCMVDSSNEEIGDKESKEFKRLAELALAEFGPDFETKVMRETFEISVAQFAGVARRNAVATRGLFPECEIESVMQTEGKRGGWVYVEPKVTDAQAAVLARMAAQRGEEMAVDEVGALGEGSDEEGMDAGQQGTPKTREYCASEYMSPTSRSRFGNMCKARFHERYFMGPDGCQYEFAHRSNSTPARYTISRVKATR